MATQPPQQKIGDYELVRLLGRGGMGEVWLASDLRADRSVALKFIKPGFLDDPAIRGRFLNEAKTLGRLEQDRIVTLYNVVEDGTNLALVLRFIDGTSLAERIDEEGALPMDFVLASARDILPALGFAHEHGIIHRDMKPQNVLLDRHGRSFLTDFGIAVGDFAERGTVTGFAVGTPHYMSPEQIQTPRSITVQSGGHRSDIYSYGVVLYEMLTGRVPFCGDSGVEEIYRVQHAHCVEAPPPLRDVNPAVPRAVEDLVLQCLEKNAGDRPQSCADLLTALNAAVDERPAPKRVSPGYAATVVEKPRVAEKPSVAKAASAIAPAVRPAEADRRRGIPKVAWLGVGAVLIVAGISFAIFSSKGTADQVKTTPPSQVAKQALVPEASLKPTPTAGRSAGPIRTISAPNVPPGPAIPAAGPLAERAYAQSIDLAQKGMPCEGLDSVNEAARLDPSNQKYQVRKAQLIRGCDVFKGAAAKYETAKLQFEQGEYCEGKSTIDEAVKAAPASMQYLELQKRLSKACAIQ
jgi:serine/threonine protein kinase